MAATFVNADSTVLILILLELTFWDLGENLLGWFGGGLNPYFTGTDFLSLIQLGDDKDKLYCVLILILLELTFWASIEMELPDFKGAS